MVGSRGKIGEIETIRVDRAETPRVERRMLDGVAQEPPQSVALMDGQPIGVPVKPIEVLGEPRGEHGAGASAESLAVMWRWSSSW